MEEKKTSSSRTEVSISFKSLPSPSRKRSYQDTSSYFKVALNVTTTKLHVLSLLPKWNMCSLTVFALTQEAFSLSIYLLSYSLSFTLPLSFSMWSLPYMLAYLSLLSFYLHTSKSRHEWMSERIERKCKRREWMRRISKQVATGQRLHFHSHSREHLKRDQEHAFTSAAR